MNKTIIRKFVFILFLFYIKIDGTYGIEVPKIKLNNGIEMPIFGLGTSGGLEISETAEVVKNAIDLGYRVFDCAWFYDNEKEVGDGIKAKIMEGVVKREDIFIISKLWNTFHKPEDVEPAFNQSLNKLGLSYIDMYLMHFPTDYKAGDNTFPTDDKGLTIPEGVDYVDTWKAMEKIYEKGLAKSIGVSNFNKSQIERLILSKSTVPVANEIEYHPYLNQKAFVDYLKTKGIITIGYAPLGSLTIRNVNSKVSRILDEPKIVEIGKRLNKTPAQIILRYSIQRDVIPIPKSSNKNRLKENINVFDFQLTPEDIQTIGSINKNLRFFDLKPSSNHRYYPFH